MPDDDLDGTRVPLTEGLRGMAVPEAPPPYLEDRLVALLAGRASLRPGGRRRPWHWLAAAAAAILLFAAGLLVGSGDASEAAAGPRYAIVLLGGPGYTPPTAEQEAISIARHRAWAGRQFEADRLVLAEKLGPTVAVLPAGGGAASGGAAGGADELLGIFVIVAASDEAAIEIARGSPHVLDGGRVAVIRIEPT